MKPTKIGSKMSAISSLNNKGRKTNIKTTDNSVKDVIVLLIEQKGNIIIYIYIIIIYIYYTCIGCAMYRFAVSNNNKEL